MVIPVLSAKGVADGVELVKELRRLTDWTLEEAGEHLSVSHKTVSQWSRGKSGCGRTPGRCWSSYWRTSVRDWASKN